MEKANFKERALYLISPEKGARAYRERVRKERLERQRDGLEIMEAVREPRGQQDPELHGRLDRWRRRGGG